MCLQVSYQLSMRYTTVFSVCSHIHNAFKEISKHPLINYGKSVEDADLPNIKLNMFNIIRSEGWCLPSNGKLTDSAKSRQGCAKSRQGCIIHGTA